MDIVVLGVDVSKKKFDVALLVNEKFLAKSYSNDKAGFEKFNLPVFLGETKAHQFCGWRP